MKKSDTIKKLKGKELVREMHCVKLTIDYMMTMALFRKEWQEKKIAKIGLVKAERLLRQFREEVK